MEPLASREASAAPGKTWRHRAASAILGLCTVVRSYPSTIFWPCVFFCVTCGVGAWAVTQAARTAADGSKARALSLASDAAAETRQLLAVAFSLTQVLASLIQNNPQYDAVSSLFSATAPALASAAPLACVRALELAPAAVVRNVYPLAGNEFLHGFDLFSDPTIFEDVLRSISAPDIAVEGPMPPLNGDGSANGGAGGLLLVVRKAVQVNVTDPGDTFGRPDHPNPLCGTPCEYNASTGTKFWGMAAVIVTLDSFRVPVGDFLVSEPLRPLAELGYRYTLMAPGLQSGTFGSSSDGKGSGAAWGPPVVVESSPSGGASGLDTVSSAVDLGPGSQWTLLVGPPCGHGWMPRWYGGVVAAVVLASLAASLVLSWLLVSRRQHQMLLHSLLPEDLIQDLQTENDRVPLEPKRLEEAETPADVLMSLLSALLAGLPADLRDVVLLRTVLRKRLDVYRPFNLGARMKEAQLESDVANALLRQLGSPADLRLGSNSSSTNPWADGGRGSFSGCGSDKESNSDMDCGYDGGGGAAGGGWRSRRFSGGGGGYRPGGGQRASAELLGTSDDPQRWEQELARKCQSIKGALSYILSGSTEKEAAATAPREGQWEDDRRSFTSVGIRLMRRESATGGGRRGSHCGGEKAVGASSSMASRRQTVVESSTDSDGRTAEAVAEATASVAAAEWAAAARRSRIMSIGGVASPSTVQRLQCARSRPSSAGFARAPQAAWSGIAQRADPGMSPSRPKSGFMLHLKPRVAAEVPAFNTAAVGSSSGVGCAGSGECATIYGGGGSVDSRTCDAVTSPRCSIELRAPPSLIPGNVPPSPTEERGSKQQQQQEGQQQVMFRLTPKQQVQQQQQEASQHQPGSPATLYPPCSSATVNVSRSRRRSSAGPTGQVQSTLSQPGDRPEGAGTPMQLLSTMPAMSLSRAAASSLRYGEPGGRTESVLSRVAVAAPAALVSYSGEAELEEEGDEDAAVATVAPSTSRLRQVVRVASPPRPLVEDVERMLSEADSWQFDTWGLQEASGGHALSALSFFLLQREGLVGRFGLEPLKLARLLRTLESGYPTSNPYHNSAHAADVLHTLHVLLHGARLTSHYVDHLGLLAAYFAAIVHDYGHPGLTNDFLVATSHPLALRYNDRAPLESHHAASAFTLLAERPDLDITAGLSKQDRAAFRKQVVELVLATDMKQHFAILNQFNTAHRLAANYVTRGLPPPPTPGLQRAQETAQHVVPPKPLNEAERLLSLQVMLKAADIGHLGAGLERHKRWLSVLEEEFFRQGDQERQLGLPISPLFDRAKQGVSKSQVGFYDFVALPLLRAAAEAFPGAAPLLNCFKSNYHHWRQVADAEAAAASAGETSTAAAVAAPDTSSRPVSTSVAAGTVPTIK